MSSNKYYKTKTEKALEKHQRTATQLIKNG